MWQIIYDVNMLICAWLACLNALIISFLLNLGHMKYKESKKRRQPCFLCDSSVKRL